MDDPSISRHSETKEILLKQYCEAEISMASRSGIFDLSDLKFGMQPPDVPPTARVLRGAANSNILKIEPTLINSPKLP